jgi:DNA-binding IclR family transcriptional regulator
MTTRKSGTVAKSIHILDTFLDSSEGQTLSVLASKTGINKSTMLRLCATLEEAGLLQRDKGMAYRLGHKIWQLALVYRRQLRLEDTVRPFLRQLRDVTGESASFYIREEEVRVCLFRENSHHRICHHVEEGARLPLQQGVVGRVLLAFSGKSGAEYEAIRQSGYLMAQGREPFTASVSAPVLSCDGTMIGALVVSGPSSRFTERVQKHALERVLTCCAALTERVPDSVASARIR